MQHLLRIVNHRQVSYIWSGRKEYDRIVDTTPLYITGHLAQKIL
jgi:hypothetical protein